MAEDGSMVEKLAPTMDGVLPTRVSDDASDCGSSCPTGTSYAAG